MSNANFYGQDADFIGVFGPIILIIAGILILIYLLSGIKIVKE